MDIQVVAEQKIRKLALSFAEQLRRQIDMRVKIMQEDETSHYLIYKVLGIATEEGRLIDEYQNKGRFLYKYAGSFLEEVAKLCFQLKHPDSKPCFIDNTLGKKPKRFGIDCLLDKFAIEIKWRDATTDGDHITKEHTRIQNIAAAGFTPIRVMFYYPNREQAQRIQETIKTIYAGVGGVYYSGDEAWTFVAEQTGINLLGILEKIAAENEPKFQS